MTLGSVCTRAAPISSAGSRSVRAMRGRRSQLPAVMMFVWMAAIASLFHLDRFDQDSLPFVAWAALYIVAPVPRAVAGQS